MTICNLCGRREYFRLLSPRKCAHCGRNRFKNTYLLELAAGALLLGLALWVIW